MLTKQGNVAARRAVLSAYKTILASLKRGCTGVLASHKVIKGLVVDSGEPQQDTNNSILLKLPTITTGYTSPYWKQLVQDEFRLGSVVGEANSKIASHQQLLKERRKLARDYAELITEIAQHERLLMDFGWGAVRDSRAELHNVARRCGLELDTNHPLLNESQEGHQSVADASVEQAQIEAEEQDESDDDDIPAFTETERDPLEPTLRKIEQYYSTDKQ
jgi:hypothetical protein